MHHSHHAVYRGSRVQSLGGSAPRASFPVVHALKITLGFPKDILGSFVQNRVLHNRIPLHLCGRLWQKETPTCSGTQTLLRHEQPA